MSGDPLLHERLHDATLSPSERAGLRQDAPLCRQLAEERIMIRRLSALLADEEASAVADRVLHLVAASRSSRVLKLASAVRRRTQRGGGKTSRMLLSVQPWPLASAALLLVVLGWWVLRANPSAAPTVTVTVTAPAVAASTIALLRTTTADVQVIRADRAIGTHAGMVLLAEDRLHSVAGGAEILYPDHTRLHIQAATELRLWDERGAKRVRLERGEVRAEVAPQPPGKAMKLLTAQAEAEVLGTRFTLVAGRELTRLEVTQGTVSLRHLDGTISVVRDGGSAQAVVASPAPTAAPDRPAPPRALLAFDFEDGVLPTEWVMGKIAMGPTRAGNRFCLAAQTNAAAPWAKVQLEAGPARALFVHGEGSELRFDYWIDEPTKSLDVYLRNDSQQATFGDLHLFDLTPRTWTRATVKLDELRAADPAARQRAGDRIALLVIQVGQQGGVLYLDNLEIVPPRTAAPRPAEP